jgi:hypothetical protein
MHLRRLGLFSRSMEYELGFSIVVPHYCPERDKVPEEALLSTPHTRTGNVF